MNATIRAESKEWFVSLNISEVNSEDTYSLPALSSNSSESVMKGNRSGTLSLVIIILLIDDAPNLPNQWNPIQWNNKETNELETLVQYAHLDDSNSSLV